MAFSLDTLRFGEFIVPEETPPPDEGDPEE
jgi:hypothetical protein